MKALHLFFILSLSILTIGCQDESTEYHSLSVIIDRSEVHSYSPKASDVLSYIKQDGYSDGISISLRYISNTFYGERIEFVLDASDTGWFSNMNDNRKRQRQFLKRFEDSLAVFNAKQQPLERSEVVRLVGEELMKASQQTSPVSILLFSDLKEHSRQYSVYDPAQVNRLLQYPDKASNQLFKGVSLPVDLTGVTFHIIYEPMIAEAQVFGAMVAIYREAIQSRGGKVIVGRQTVIH